MSELEELQAAARDVLRAANHDPDEGPTGMAEALSKLATLVYPMPLVPRPSPDRGEILTMLRRLTAHVAYVLDGQWPQYDPYPDRIDELCHRLQLKADK